MRSLARSLIVHGSITTTEPKAKELRPYIEKLVTKGKVNSVASVRTIASVLDSSAGAQRIVSAIAPKYADRKGGYTRIMKLPRRLSDGSPMAIIEFV